MKIDSLQFGFMAGISIYRCNFHCSPATGEISESRIERTLDGFCGFGEGSLTGFPGKWFGEH